MSVFLGAGSYFIAMLTYAFVDGRFYLPLFLLLVPLAILPDEWAVPSALKLRYSLPMIAVVRVLVLTWLCYPSQSGFKPEKNRFQAWDALRYTQNTGMSRQYEAEEELALSFRDPPSIVLSDMDCAYLNVLSPKPFVAAPIDEKHYYCYSRLWHYGKAEAIRLVTDGLDHAIPVYALFVPSEHLDQDVDRLPQTQGYTWKRSDRSGTSAVIMVLTKGTVVNSLDRVPAQRG